MENNNELLNEICKLEDDNLTVAEDLTMMHIYFKETRIRKYLRDEYFGTADAIGNLIF